MQTKKSTLPARAGGKKLSSGPSAKKMKSGKNLFHQLFIDELKDIYWAEKHLSKNLPKVIKAATTGELRDAVGGHLRETEKQVRKLERVFELIGEKPQAKKCEAMEGLVEEASNCIEDTEAGSYTRDAGLIVCAQKVEHYEIATYGSLYEFALLMGHDDAAAILKEILEEERSADKKLMEAATSGINQMAMEEWGKDGDEMDKEE